jgi:hypothetical protein
MKQLILTAAIALASALSLTAQNKDPEVKLTLRDGNTITGTSKMGNVVLITAYGKLDIPIKNVSSIEVGLPSDKSQEEKVINLVKQLGSSNEEMRKNAYTEVTKLSIGCIPVLNDYLSSGKYQPAEYTDFTPESALSELMAIYNIGADYSDKDVITVDYTYTMGGTYDFKKIDLKTEYGVLSIPKEKIKHVEILYIPTGDGSDLVFTLMASKHISSNTSGGWLKTGIMVKSSQRVSINASGEVVLASLSGNKYKPSGKIVGGTPNEESEYEGDGTYPKYGQVVYKVGENGTATKAGDKFSGTMKENGMLYISIYETVYSASNTGTYIVKISLK